MALVEREQPAEIDVGQAITVRDHESLAGGVSLDPGHARTGAGGRAGLDELDVVVLLVVLSEVLDAELRAELDLDVVRHRLVVEEELLDEIALVAEAQHELAQPLMAEHLHDVPEDRASADLDQRLGPELGLLAKTGAETAAQNHCLHCVSPFVTDGGREMCSRGAAGAQRQGPYRRTFPASVSPPPGSWT